MQENRRLSGVQAIARRDCLASMDTFSFVDIRFGQS